MTVRTKNLPSGIAISLGRKVVDHICDQQYCGYYGQLSNENDPGLAVPAMDLFVNGHVRLPISVKTLWRDVESEEV